MKLVIDIPEEIYQRYKKVWQKRRGSIPESCIAFGTPLPQEPTHTSEVVQKAYEDGKKDGYMQRKLEQEQDKPMVEIDLYSVIKQKYIEREVLDKIRARIELEKLGYPPSAGYYKAIMKVLQIIDKYKAESEDGKT